METKTAKTLAQNLLDSEFETFDHNPKLYLESLGWDTKQDKILIFFFKFASIQKLKGVLYPTAEDIENLTSILESIDDTEEPADIPSNNSVSDFISNCVAEHIISNLK